MIVAKGWAARRQAFTGSEVQGAPKTSAEVPIYDKR